MPSDSLLQGTRFETCLDLDLLKPCLIFLPIHEILTVVMNTALCSLGELRVLQEALIFPLRENTL